MIPFVDGQICARNWVTFENLTCLEAVGSSNDLARELIEVYLEEDQQLPPTVLLAQSQPGARGRTGRWIAPAGRGLYVTFLRATLPTEPLTLLPLAFARWLRDALEEAAGVAARVKWPNDLYVGRRKLAGVLAESRTQGESTYVAIGIGVNVRGQSADLGLPGATATTLETEANRPLLLAEVAQTVLDRVDREMARARWESEPRAWEQVAVHRRGDSITVARDGSEVTGKFAGLTSAGFLRLETESGEETLSAGEVTAW